MSLNHWILSDRSGLYPTNAEERIYLESLIREDFERCHPNDTLDDLKRRASFSREDRGLLRDWMALAARRAAADPARKTRLTSAASASQACAYRPPSRCA